MMKRPVFLAFCWFVLCNLSTPLVAKISEEDRRDFSEIESSRNFAILHPFVEKLDAMDMNDQRVRKFVLTQLTLSPGYFLKAKTSQSKKSHKMMEKIERFANKLIVLAAPHFQSRREAILLHAAVGFFFQHTTDELAVGDDGGKERLARHILASTEKDPHLPLKMIDFISDIQLKNINFGVNIFLPEVIHSYLDLAFLAESTPSQKEKFDRAITDKSINILHWFFQIWGTARESYQRDNPNYSPLEFEVLAWIKMGTKFNWFLKKIINQKNLSVEAVENLKSSYFKAFSPAIYSLLSDSTPTFLLFERMLTPGASTVSNTLDFLESLVLCDQARAHELIKNMAKEHTIQQNIIGRNISKTERNHIHAFTKLQTISLLSHFDLETENFSLKDFSHLLAVESRRFKDMFDFNYGMRNESLVPYDEIISVRPEERDLSPYELEIKTQSNITTEIILQAFTFLPPESRMQAVNNMIKHFKMFGGIGYFKPVFDKVVISLEQAKLIPTETLLGKPSCKDAFDRHAG